MAGKDVQQPGGTTEQENNVTGLARQIRIDTERHSIRVHDGSKQGGHEIPTLEMVETLLISGGGNDVANNVIQQFNSITELKAAQPALNIYAILREAGIEDTFIWKAGSGDLGDIASDISGHWKRLGNEINEAVSLWRAGMINLQIGGAQPVANQTITAWLSANQLKLWDGTDYLDPTPVLWMKLFAAVGGFYTGAVSLPDRLNAQSFEIANLDTVVESGWYKSAAAAAGAPVAGVHSFEHRELTSAIAIQLFYPHNSATRNYWIRYRTAVTPTWTSWIEVAGALPARLAATSTAATVDANAVVESGFYSLNSVSPNLPTAAAYTLLAIRTAATDVTQLAFAAGGTIYRRVMVASAWGAWVALSLDGHIHDDRYFTESEVTALLAGKAAAVHNHDDRYYTESEVNSLLSAKAPLVPGLGAVGSYIFWAAAGDGSLAPTELNAAYGGAWIMRGHPINIGGTTSGSTWGLYQRTS